MTFPQISETPAILDFFLDDEAWGIALRNVGEVFSALSKYKGISTKTKSEIISGIVAEELTNVLNEKNELEKYFFRGAASDNEPDIVVEGVSMEIPTVHTKQPWLGVAEVKVAKATKDTKGNYSVTWRGGELSKRDGDYFFVAWDFVDDSIEWFVCHAFVKKTDWKSSLQNGYYATTITTEQVLDNHLGEVVLGSLSLSAKGNSRFKIAAAI